MNAAGPDAFARVLAAEGVSNFGSMLSRLAIPWIASLMLGATPWQMGLLIVADVVAAGAGALLLGPWVDRSGKRRVMLLADGLRAAVLAAVALAAWQGVLGFGGLLAAAAAGGLLTVAFELARSAWMAECLAAGELPARNARLAMVGSLSETAAFASGGWLYQAGGAVVSLAVDAASYVVSALCLKGVPETTVRRAPPQPARWWHDLGEGWRTVRSVPALRALAGVQALLALSSALAGTSYMIFVSRDIGFETGPLGVVFALGGLGAIAGAWIAPALGRRLGPGRAMALGLAAFALGAACIPLVAQAGWLGLALLVAHQVVGDAGHTVHDVHDRTLRQTAVPAERLARADGGIRVVEQVATLAGALGGGWLATAIGTRGALGLAAVLGAAAAVAAALTLGRGALQRRSPST